MDIFGCFWFFLWKLCLSPPLSAKAAKVPLEIHDAQGWAAEGALFSSLTQTLPWRQIAGSKWFQYRTCMNMYHIYIYNRIYTLLVQLYQTWIGGHPSFSVCRCCPLLLLSGDRVTPEMGMAALAQKSIWQESWCQHLPTNTSLWQHSTKGVFSPVQNASGVENPHIFLNIEHCKWQQRVPHSFAAIAVIAMLFRKGCVLSWVRQTESQSGI